MMWRRPFSVDTCIHVEWSRSILTLRAARLSVSHALALITRNLVQSADIWVQYFGQDTRSCCGETSVVTPRAKSCQSRFRLKRVSAQGYVIHTHAPDGFSREFQSSMFPVFNLNHIFMLSMVAEDSDASSPGPVTSTTCPSFDP
jgi:hypothetical protein